MILGGTVCINYEIKKSLRTTMRRLQTERRNEGIAAWHRWTQVYDEKGWDYEILSGSPEEGRMAVRIDYHETETYRICRDEWKQAKTYQRANKLLVRPEEDRRYNINEVMWEYDPIFKRYGWKVRKIRVGY